MLPVNSWYAGFSGSTRELAEVAATRVSAPAGRSLRRLAGHALIRLGWAVSRPARVRRVPLARTVVAR
jgi:hypothetical protein